MGVSGTTAQSPSEAVHLDPPSRGTGPRFPGRGLRIAIVCYPSLGGSGIVASELARALTRRHHTVHVVSPEPPFRLRTPKSREGVHLHEVHIPGHPLLKEGPYGLALAGTLARLAEQDGLDVVHVHYALPHTPAAILAREMGPPGVRVVTTLHGTDVTWAGRDPALRRTLAWALGQSDGVTAVSHDLAERAKQVYGLRTVDRVPNFIDLATWHPRPLRRLRRELAPDGQVVLLHASNFRPVKRSVETVNILAEVRRTRPAELVLVGNGPDRDACLTRARALGVLPHVHVLGSRNDLPLIMPAADVFLLPSEDESFGLAALEAMACGVPVVASRVGGLPEVVADPIAGRLLPLHDTSGMAAAALELTEPELHAQVARSAAAWASDHFADEAVLPLYESVYDRARSGSPA